jgi:hypothetical protein
MSLTKSDTSVARFSRVRLLRFSVSVAAGFGPPFLFAVWMSNIGRLAPRLGLSESFVANHFRLILVIGLLTSLIASRLLLELVRRRFPASKERLETTVNPAAFARAYIPVWLHGTLTVVVSFAGAVGATVFSQWLDAYMRLGDFWSFVVLAISFILGFNAPMLLLLKVVPARCRKCSGKSWGSFGTGTLLYTCHECGFVRRSRLTID